MKAMKAAKASKAMKVMKAMKAKKVSKSFAKVVAFRGKSIGGATKLTKVDFIKNKFGWIVSKKQFVLVKVWYALSVGKWVAALTKVWKELGVKGFQAVKKGT